MWETAGVSDEPVVLLRRNPGNMFCPQGSGEPGNEFQVFRLIFLFRDEYIIAIIKNRPIHLRQSGSFPATHRMCGYKVHSWREQLPYTGPVVIFHSGNIREYGSFFQPVPMFLKEGQCSLHWCTENHNIRFLQILWINRLYQAHSQRLFCGFLCSVKSDDKTSQLSEPFCKRAAHQPQSDNGNRPVFKVTVHNHPPVVMIARVIQHRISLHLQNRAPASDALFFRNRL